MPAFQQFQQAYEYNQGKYDQFKEVTQQCPSFPQKQQSNNQFEQYLLCYEGTNYPILKEVAIKMDFNVAEDMYDFLWTDRALTIKEIKAEQLTTRINHIPEITQVTRKNKMARNLNSLKNYFPKDYNFYPETWILPFDHQRLMKKHTKGKIYICKPENSCQGQGIYLIDHPNKLGKFTNQVVQQYIMNPYLIDGLKFDLRIYVLITCVNPLRVYLYNEGLVRFATQMFQKPNEANMDNYFSHLTNYAINKANQKFKVDQNNQNQGHKRLISSVFKNQEYSTLMQKVSKIIVKTIISGLPSMQNAFGHCRKVDPSSCFQLLGFDIILNDKKEPILLEVNQNPSLVTDSQLDYHLKSQLIQNILEMVSGGMNSNEERIETKIKMKDRHEAAFKRNFIKIYPCSNLEETEQYDEFIIRSNTIYKDKFGINFGKVTRPTQSTFKIEEEPLSWNEQPNHYTRDKVQKVYRARLIKTSYNSVHKARAALI